MSDNCLNIFPRSRSTVLFHSACKNFHPHLPEEKFVYFTCNIIIIIADSFVTLKLLSFVSRVLLEAGNFVCYHIQRCLHPHCRRNSLSLSLFSECFMLRSPLTLPMLLQHCKHSTISAFIPISRCSSDQNGCKKFRAVIFLVIEEEKQKFVQKVVNWKCLSLDKSLVNVNGIRVISDLKHGCRRRMAHKKFSIKSYKKWSLR